MNNFPITLTVSQLNECVKTVLDNAPYFGNIYVTGEITNFSHHYKTGHIYFTLKDEKSIVKAVMFKSDAVSLRFSPKDSMLVTVHGRVSCYTRDGIYQIYVDSMEPLGTGALYLAFEQLKKKLSDEGLFDDDNKKEIPVFPKKVGIITSPTGAAVEDMKNIISRRYPLCEILIYPATVQGKNAPGELIAGLDFFEKDKSCDTVIIGRGGGSFEDLFCFNDEQLARKIHSFSIPIISAVGHEVDYTICDFVCDLRAPTPSAAAELCVPDISELLIQLHSLKTTLFSSLKSHIQKAKSHISTFSSMGFFTSPELFFDDKKSELCAIEQAIQNSLDNRIALLKSKIDNYNFDKTIQNRVEYKRMMFEKIADGITPELFLQNKKQQLSLSAEKMAALNPMAVLCRGYSAVTDENEKIVTHASQLKTGDSINVKMVDGVACASVTGIHLKDK